MFKMLVKKSIIVFRHNDFTIVLPNLVFSLQQLSNILHITVICVLDLLIFSPNQNHSRRKMSNHFAKISSELVV